MVALVSRTGRHLQRYNKGRRLVVGCIPYRYRITKKTSLEKNEEELEVLVISSQKGKGILFPKGGWETDESIKEAALRETVEEAGVRGIVECELGKWRFMSKSHDTYKEGYMFPLLVTEQLDFWPEKNVRQRIWMSVPEAREACQQWWMKEALDILVRRLASPQQHEEEGRSRTLSSKLGEQICFVNRKIGVGHHHDIAVRPEECRIEAINKECNILKKRKYRNSNF